MNEYHNVVDVVQNNALLSHHQLLDNLIIGFYACAYILRMVSGSLCFIIAFCNV